MWNIYKEIKVKMNLVKQLRVEDESESLTKQFNKQSMRQRFFFTDLGNPSFLKIF